MAKSDKQSRIRRRVILFLTMVAALALLYGWLEGGPNTSNLPRPFDSTRWKAANADARCGMVADLIYRIGVVGRTRGQIYEMLGQPETESNGTPGLDHWHLCPSSMDVYILEVRWKDNRVAAAHVRDT